MAAALRSTPGLRQGELSSLGWSLAAHGILVLLIALGGVVWPRDDAPRPLGIEAVVLDARDLKPARKRPAPAPRPDPAEQQQQRELERRQAEERAAAEQREAAEAERRAAEERQAAEARRQREEAAAEQQAREKAAAEKSAAQQAKLAAEKTAAKKAAAEKAAAQKAAAEKATAEKAAREAAAAKAAAEKAAKEKAAADAKAAAAKATAEAQRRQAATDLARQLAEEEELASAAGSGALAEYIDLIRQKVERNWIPPPGVRPGLECEVLVNQLPGGTVGDVRIGACNGDDAVRRSIEAAVRRADPLPLPSNPALFERNLRFTFKPEE
jgi:colicin import membrane protein